MSGGEYDDQDIEDIPPSWGRIDLGDALSGNRKPVAATLLERTDGVFLIYPGLTHDFHGESDTGKSMILQAECVQVINRGEDVLYIDHESDPNSVVDRLIMLGADPLMIAKHFDYRQPESSPGTSEAEQGAWEGLLANRYTLVVIDGVSDALGIFGYSISNNDDLAAWSRTVARRIAARTGAAVALIDHVTKDANSRGRWAIGGQAKMSGITGASYMVEVTKVFGQGLCGEVVLRLAKERPGTLKRSCGPMRKSDKTQEAARIVIDSTGDKTVLTVNPWKGSSGGGEPQEDRPFRPTYLMEKVSRTIEDHPGEYTKTSAAQATYGNKDALLKGIDILKHEEYLTEERKGRHRYLTSAKPYREANDPLSDNYSTLGSRLRAACEADEPNDGDDDGGQDTP